MPDALRSGLESLSQEKLEALCKGDEAGSGLSFKVVWDAMVNITAEVMCMYSEETLTGLDKPIYELMLRSLPGTAKPFGQAMLDLVTKVGSGGDFTAVALSGAAARGSAAFEVVVKMMSSALAGDANCGATWREISAVYQQFLRRTAGGGGGGGGGGGQVQVQAQTSFQRRQQEVRQQQQQPAAQAAGPAGHAHPAWHGSFALLEPMGHHLPAGQFRHVVAALAPTVLL